MSHAGLTIECDNGKNGCRQNQHTGFNGKSSDSYLFYGIKKNYSLHEGKC